MRYQKKVTGLLLTAALCLLLGGCGGGKAPAQSPPVPENSAENTQTQAPGVPAEETPVPDKPTAAKDVYLDFLSGKGVVTTSEAFRRVEGVYNENSPDYGTYSYQELKYAIAPEMMGDGTPRYAFLDIDGDGVEDLLALRFENEDPGLFNWTGIIRYDDGELTLTYSYEDGYRIAGELFTSGYLIIGGSGGAGTYGENRILISEDGTATLLCETFEYWGSFANSIYYQLGDLQRDPTEEKYYYFPEDFYVSTYSNENGLKVYVEYSGDAEARATEEAFAQELTEMGVRLMDEEEFSRCLAEKGTYCVSQVTWTDFEDGLPPYFNAEVTACYPEQWWYICNPDYEEAVLDDTEYAVWVAVETTKPVTDFQVVSLEITDYTEHGLVCSTEELYSLPALTPEKPLLIALSFPGDLPSCGVRFVDTFGDQRLFTFCQSGMDGSLLFEEAALAGGE